MRKLLKQWREWMGPKSMAMSSQYNIHCLGLGDPHALGRLGEEVTFLVGVVVLEGSGEADHHLEQEDTGDGEDTEEDGLLPEVVGADRGALFDVDAVLRDQLRRERGGIRLHEALLEGGVRGLRQAAAAHLHPKSETCLTYLKASVIILSIRTG